MALGVACFYASVAALWAVMAGLMAVNWYVGLPAGPAQQCIIAGSIVYVGLIFVGDALRWARRSRLERGRHLDRRPQI